MTDKEWDLVQEVHVKGAFSCTKAAWPHMRKQKYGRIINVSNHILGASCSLSETWTLADGSSADPLLRVDRFGRRHLRQLWPGQVCLICLIDMNRF